MTEMEIKEQIEKIKDKEAFFKSFENVNSADEIVALFKAEGIEVAKEKAEAAYDALKNAGELDEAALESVSGGFGPFAAVAAVAGMYVGGLAVSYAFAKVWY